MSAAHSLDSRDVRPGRPRPARARLSLADPAPITVLAAETGRSEAQPGLAGMLTGAAAPVGDRTRTAAAARPDQVGTTRPRDRGCGGHRRRNPGRAPGGTMAVAGGGVVLLAAGMIAAGTGLSSRTAPTSSVATPAPRAAVLAWPPPSLPRGASTDLPALDARPARIAAAGDTAPPGAATPLNVMNTRGGTRSPVRAGRPRPGHMPAAPAGGPRAGHPPPRHAGAAGSAAPSSPRPSWAGDVAHGPAANARAAGPTATPARKSPPVPPDAGDSGTLGAALDGLGSGL